MSRRAISPRMSMAALVVVVAVAGALLLANRSSDDGQASSGGSESRSGPHDHAGPARTTGEVRRDGHGRYVTVVMPGIEETSRWPPGTDATDEQSAAQEELVRSTRAALAGVVDLADAQARGWTIEEPTDTDSVHWLNPDHIDDGRLLDPERPEALVVQRSSGTVVGAMFISLDPDAQPQPGPDARWHAHTFDHPLCFFLSGRDLADGAPFATEPPCPAGTAPARRTSMHMLHVWLVHNPGGPFAHEMDIHLQPGEVDTRRIN